MSCFYIPPAWQPHCVCDVSGPAMPECLQSSMFGTLGTDQLSLNFNNHKPPSTPVLTYTFTAHVKISQTFPSLFVHCKKWKCRSENESMQSTHQGLVSCPLARETTLGLTAPDPNPGTRLKMIIRELNWK